MRTRLPALRTLPSTTYCTPSSRATSCTLDRLALVDEGRVARDHEQVAKARQLGDDVLGHAVGEELLLGSPLMLANGSTAIDGLSAAGRHGVGRAPAPAAPARAMHAVGAHRLGDVLQRLLAQILEAAGDAVAAPARCTALGDADAAGIGERLQPRGDVDAVAVDVPSASLDHVAQVDADAKAHAPSSALAGAALGDLVAALRARQFTAPAAVSNTASTESPAMSMTRPVSRRYAARRPRAPHPAR